MPDKPRILYVTCAENGLYGLKNMIRAGAVIEAVVTLPPELGVKYNISGYADVGAWTKKQGIRTVLLDNYTLKPEAIRNLTFDAIIVNGWNRLIPDEVISMAPLGALGVHAGHPPIGLGRAPLVWNIINGNQDIEVYVFRLTPAADDGDIMALRTVEICQTDDVQTLYEKVMFAASQLFTEALERLHRGEQGIRQNLEYAVHFEKRTPEDGAINFLQSETQIYDFIRAQAPPYPGAFAYLGKCKWTFLIAAPFDRFAFRGIRRTPGRIAAALPSGLVIETGGAPIWLQRAKSEDGDQLPSDLDDLEAMVGKQFTSLPGPVDGN